jgi:hypothetical protein
VGAGVRLNNVNHHQTGGTDPLGQNHGYLAIGKEPICYFPQRIASTSGALVRYQDYTDPATRPVYLPDPAPGDVVQPSIGAYACDFALGDGHENIRRLDRRRGDRRRPLRAGARFPRS